jgi:hypothetical protein
LSAAHTSSLDYTGWWGCDYDYELESKRISVRLKSEGRVHIIIIDTVNKAWAAAYNK